MTTPSADELVAPSCPAPAHVEADSALAKLHGYYRVGHGHWGYEGDFFNLYREANYGPNLDIYNAESFAPPLPGDTDGNGVVTRDNRLVTGNLSRTYLSVPSIFGLDLFGNSIEGVVDDIFVYRYPEGETGYFVCINGANVQKDIDWWLAQAAANPEFDVTITDLQPSIGMLAIQGPLAESILQKVIDVDLSQIPYFTWFKGKIAGVEPSSPERLGARIRQALKSGALTTDELAEEIDAEPASVRKARCLPAIGKAPSVLATGHLSAARWPPHQTSGPQLLPAGPRRGSRGPE